MLRSKSVFFNAQINIGIISFCICRFCSTRILEGILCTFRCWGLLVHSFWGFFYICISCWGSSQCRTFCTLQYIPNNCFRTSFRFCLYTRTRCNDRSSLVHIRHCYSNRNHLRIRYTRQFHQLMCSALVVPCIRIYLWCSNLMSTTCSFRWHRLWRSFGEGPCIFHFCSSNNRSHKRCIIRLSLYRCSVKANSIHRMSNSISRDITDILLLSLLFCNKAVVSDNCKHHPSSNLTRIQCICQLHLQTYNKQVVFDTDCFCSGSNLRSISYRLHSN